MINKSMFKKLLASILLATYLLTVVFVPPVKAQGLKSIFGTGPWYNQSFQQWYTKVYDDNNSQEIFGERYTAAQVDWIIWSALTWLPTKIVGPDLIVCAFSLATGEAGECIEQLLHTGNIPVQQPAAARNEKNLFASVFEERQFSGITYFKNLGRKFNLIPEAKAQVKGFGFEGALLPIQHMWKASRNIAYTLFVLVTIVFAFMIMFRVKISPQVVITVQSALPKLIIAIILVTFSYAIAGFLIDLMYVVIGIISLVGKGFLPSNVSSTTIFNLLTKGQPLNLDLQAGIFLLFPLYLVVFLVSLAIILIFTFGLIQAALVSAIAIALIGSSISTVIGGIILSLILTVIAVVLIWMGIKIIWGLTRAYVNILLLTIFAPFQIVLGALIPSFGFSAWLKSFVSNLSVFVVTGTMFLLSFSFLIQALLLAGRQFFEGFNLNTLANIFLGTSGVEEWEGLLSSGGGGAWPPLLGFGESGAPLLLLAASFVIFTLIPSTSKIIESIMQGKPFTYGAAIGETLTTPAKLTVAGMPGERAVSRITRADTSAGRVAERLIAAIGKRL